MNAGHVISQLYDLASSDGQRCVHVLYGNVGVFDNTHLLELRESFARVGLDDTPTVRAVRFERLGDIFRELTSGPVSIFRDLAVEAYDAAAVIDGVAPQLLLKSGAAWFQRINGERRHNCLRAIQQLEFLLKRIGAEAPRVRGLANNILGLALSEFLIDSNTEKGREADACFRDALRAFEQTHDEPLQAMVWLNRGNLYAKLADVNLAVDCYQRALDLYEKLQQLPDIALVERNLGGTLLDRTSEDASDDIERSIGLLESSLDRVPKSADPHANAVTLNNLGRAYAMRIKGSQTENFKVAHDHFHHAAAIFQELGELEKTRIAIASAGGIRYEEHKWAEAASLFEQAATVVDHEWQERVTAQSKVALGRDAARFFDFAVIAAMRAGDRVRAIRLLERGRHKLLVDTYYSKGLEARPGSASNLWQQVQLLRRKRAMLENQLTRQSLQQSNSHNPHESPQVLHREVENLRLHEESIHRELKCMRPDFLPEMEPLEAAEIIRLASQLDAHICVLKPTSKGTIVIVFNPNGDVQGDLLERVTSTYWESLLFGPHGWCTTYRAFRAGEAFALYRWLASFDATLRAVYEELIRPCFSMMGLAPLDENVTPRQRSRLYVMAGGALDLLPLHAALCQESGERKYVADVADVAYFSSFRLLQQSLKSGTRLKSSDTLTTFRSHFFNPVFSPWEEAYARKIFGAIRSEAVMFAPDTNTSLTQLASGRRGAVNVLSCHAIAQPKDGLRSGLFVSSNGGEADISIADLLGIELPACPLVLLSACETSLKELYDPADECLSLANVFLAIGAAAAIGTQWAANDLASAMWTGKFLAEFLASPSDPLRATFAASLWLRDSSRDQKVELLESCPDKLPPNYKFLLTKDFTHPFLWANHKFYGAAAKSDAVSVREQ